MRASWLYAAPEERERCPACESLRLSDLDLHEMWQAVNGRRTGFVEGCEDCGLVFVNPLPSDEAQATFYSPEGEWGRPRAADDPAPTAKASTRHGAAAWSRMFDAIRHLLPVTTPPAGVRVLDFGCGPGKLLDALQDCGWETFGIETAMERAFRRHRRLVAVPAEPTFDLIVASHVLEHLVNPLALLRQFASASKPGGYLLVSAPGFDALPLHREYKYVINGRAHLTAYTRACMDGLLARSGWQTVDHPGRNDSGAELRDARKLRVLARRASTSLPTPARPLEAARESLRLFYRHTAGRPPLQRLGFFRLSARLVETRRQIRRDIARIRYRLGLRARLLEIYRRCVGTRPAPHSRGTPRSRP
ncbi:MAG: class I SAM-dependent methyltransferase [Vicinamibacterales bacterium]